MKQRFAVVLSELNIWALLRDGLFLTAGSVLMALDMALFLIPADLAPGGVSGVAIILHPFTGWPIGLTMLVLNIPLLILGFYQLGRFRFLSRTMYVVLLSNIGTDLLPQFLPATGITDDLLLNALYGAVVGGIASGLIYLGGGTSAGTSVIARVIQFRTGYPISQIYFLTDGGVIFASAFVFGGDKALYALMVLFIWGVVGDYVLEGPSRVRIVFIVTKQPQAVSEALLSHIGIGVTAWEGQGMFTEAGRTVLFCVISRPEVSELRSVVNEIDPQAFLVIGQGHQASGGVLGQMANGKRSRVQEAVH